MSRKDEIQTAYNRGHLLTLKNEWYREQVLDLIAHSLSQDLGLRGDITSRAICTNRKIEVHAMIEAKEDGIIAGIEEASLLYNNRHIKIVTSEQDGTSVQRGAKILELCGSCIDILETERTGLNILRRMSGIATTVCRLAAKLEKISSKALIAATRKNPWGNLDNKAVHVGGGLTHRLGLWDSMLIKENHLAILKKEGIKTYIQEAIHRAVVSHYKDANFIEIEVSSEKETLAAARCFAKMKDTHDIHTSCVIMLDNMVSSQVDVILRQVIQDNLYENIIFEVSGEITADNFEDYARTPVDILSFGSITHSVSALDLSQSIVSSGD